MSVDVVVVNWNAGLQLHECISSLYEFGSGEISSITVVDNGSTDGSADHLESKGVILFNAGENLGFGRACNIGATRGTAEFILFLNPDAAVYPDTIVRVVEYMSSLSNKHVGVCGVQLIDEKGHVSRSCTRFPTVKNMLAHSLGIDRFIPSAGYFMAEWDHCNDRSVDHVIGAFYFIRRDIFEQLNGFDERFFVYLEDLDLSRRVKELGSSIEFLASIQAFHKGGGTSEQVKATRLFYSLRSRIIYCYKHFDVLSSTLILFNTIAVESILRMIQAAFRRSRTAIKETFSAYKMLLKWLPKWWRRGVTR